MKTTLTCMAMVLGVTLNLACAGRVMGDDSTPTVQKDNDFKGTITFVAQKEKAVSVKDFWGTRTFNIAADCKVSLEDQPDATLENLHPGQKAEVFYKNVQGVLVADQIIQHNQVFTGYISAMDPVKHMLVVKHGVFADDFVVPEGCRVTIGDDTTKSLADLKIGNTVNVIYESGNGSLLAQRIEQKNPTFVGTVQAIDAGTRIVKAKDLLSRKTFHLADDCKIVTNGKTDGNLSNLRIGERLTFTYENANGVLVANRIGRDAATAETESPRVSMNNNSTP